ncbi:unnamed protein product [Victoria cruziana]
MWIFSGNTWRGQPFVLHLNPVQCVWALYFKLELISWSGGLQVNLLELMAAGSDFSILPMKDRAAEVKRATQQFFQLRKKTRIHESPPSFLPLAIPPKLSKMRDFWYDGLSVAVAVTY